MAPDWLKHAFAVVDPKAVRSPIIIANVEVRPAISVDIPERGGKAPIFGGRRQWFSGFVQESFVPKNFAEVTLPVVKVKKVGLAKLNQISFGNHETVAKLGPKFYVAVDPANADASRIACACIPGRSPT